MVGAETRITRISYRMVIATDDRRDSATRHKRAALAPSSYLRDTLVLQSSVTSVELDNSDLQGKFRWPPMDNNGIVFPFTFNLVVI